MAIFQSQPLKSLCQLRTSHSHPSSWSSTNPGNTSKIMAAKFEVLLPSTSAKRRRQ